LLPLRLQPRERERRRARERKESLARARSRSTDRERKTEVDGVSNTVGVDTMQPKLVAIFWSCSGGELFGEGRRPCGPSSLKDEAGSGHCC
jgi:hypothetical protein